MDSRREFIKKAAAIAGGMGILNTLPASVQRAFAIDPASGSTYLDAEHVVILMQENRSFDHCFGTLQGVRGFNDPRAIALPDGAPVWLQRNAAGEAYLPFRLNIKDTKSTWTGSLPHSRESQMDARNDGKYDQWLISKASHNKAYADAPLTLGYYTREDLPFYYALADAFTVCDQNFCSSLTGTTPNRLYLWTGTVKASKEKEAFSHLKNEDVNYDAEAGWGTFPERLEENGVSWKIYQNELSIESGLNNQEDAWLSGFADNPIEWFKQYQVRFSKSHQDYLRQMEPVLPGEIRTLELKINNADPTDSILPRMIKNLTDKKALLKYIQTDGDKWSSANFEKLPQKEKDLHTKAFTVNSNDPFYRQLDTLHYEDGNIGREVKVPKGDVLHQFREDVRHNELPSVSWLVAPENFSDHPNAPWYGAWYVSEVMDILTQNPEVWKKTIFILCYDENDGYFDHIPPFVPCEPDSSDTGLASGGIDVSTDHAGYGQDKQSRPGVIGLGFRVPLVIASPWTRGGSVCSQVFDHTSIIQLLEKIFSHRTGKKIEETNISSWRRAVCGDLSAVFHPYNGEKVALPAFLEQDQVIESIHKAQFKKDPSGYHSLTTQEREQLRISPASSAFMPKQEKGIRPACALPYQLYAEGRMRPDQNAVEIQFEAQNEIFGDRTAGCPFIVYAHGKHIARYSGGTEYESNRTWNYAVSAGDSLSGLWPLDQFENEIYHLAIYGPNGFFRQIQGNANDPAIIIRLEYERNRGARTRLTGNVLLTITHKGADQPREIIITDNAYKNPVQKKWLGIHSSSQEEASILLDLSKSFGWYDFTVTVTGNHVFSKRYAGHVETGTRSSTDPAMGGLI